MRNKLITICSILICMFCFSLNVFAEATSVKETDSQFSTMKSQYNNFNNGERISVTNSEIITLYGKSECNGTSCKLTYAGTNSSDFKEALSTLITCTNGEKNIIYQVGGTGKDDFKEDNKDKYSGTVYWSEEYQVTCSTSTSGDTNVLLNNSNNTNTTTTTTTTTRVITNNDNNNEYNSSTPEDNPQTGVTTYFIVLSVIALVSYGIMLLAKKYNLFKSI